MYKFIFRKYNAEIRTNETYFVEKYILNLLISEETPIQIVHLVIDFLEASNIIIILDDH